MKSILAALKCTVHDCANEWCWNVMVTMTTEGEREGGQGRREGGRLGQRKGDQEMGFLPPFFALNTHTCAHANIWGAVCAKIQGPGYKCEATFTKCEATFTHADYIYKCETKLQM